MAYMPRYRLHRFTVILPHVDNDGAPARYAADYHNALVDAGFNFTTYQTTGVWKGTTETGTLFELYIHGERDHNKVAKQLGQMARAIAPDQEAIQVTYDPIPTTVYEA